MKALSNPAIVVVAYNRAASLTRLLRSLENAQFETYQHIPLIISIDKSENYEVTQIAEDFVWKHGPKTVRTFDHRQGLKSHILSCGDLTIEYGSVIVLEDDILVSPFFYDYAVRAREFYATTDDIAGISLYNQRFNETASRPFEPFTDSSDVYFVQLASSWGQLWTRSQWGNFRSWYDQKHRALPDPNSIPHNIRSWPETSWKRYFVKYLIHTNRYFVYPRFSLTTNFCDPGTHNKESNTLLQVPLLLAPHTFRFVEFSKSNAIYDAYMEILPSALQDTNPQLRDISFSVDLYATKPLQLLQESAHVLTTRPTRSALKAFGRELRPHDANVILNIPGETIHLTSTSNLTSAHSSKNSLNNIEYDYPALRNHILPRGMRDASIWLVKRTAQSVKNRLRKLIST